MNIKRNEVTLETKYRCCAQWVTAPVTVYFFRNPRLNFLVFFRGGGWLRMAQHEISPSYPTLTSRIPPTANHSGTVDNPGSSHGTLFIVV